MAEHLNIKPGEWISIGRKSAVITKIYDPSNIEVVYLDDRDRAINEEAVWKGNCWEFKHQGPCGGYADKIDRLDEFVSILRQGRRFNSN